jgi:type VII secretion protein EccB
MASRSDQLHSHQFTLQRVVNAIALRDPGAISSPSRRSGGAVFASVMLAILAVAAVGVYGVLRPAGSPTWRDGHSMIIEKETGARYVYRDGVLYPVLNHASALLILGADRSAPVTVPRAALAGVTRGTPLGIGGAPDPLPAASDLVAGEWRLCSRRITGGGDPAARESVLAISTPMAATPLGEGALFATDSAGGWHLLWHGHRFPVADRASAVALGWGGTDAAPVATAVLNAIPAGPDIAAPPVAGIGQPSTVGGHVVGEVVKAQTEGGPGQYAVILARGAAEITQLQANLLIAAPVRARDTVIELSPAQFAALPRVDSAVPVGDTAPPPVAPALVAVPAAGAVCATFADGEVTPHLVVVSDATAARGEVRVPASTSVNWVVLPPGRGALVESRSGTAATGALGLVDDRGVLYPLTSADLLAVLGFGGVTPVRLPSGLVALLPVGPALDPAAARRSAA